MKIKFDQKKSQKILLNKNKNNIKIIQNKLIKILKYYKISIDKIYGLIGPNITLFEIIPKSNIRISQFKNLEADIALRLSVISIRIIAPLPGRGTIGIEIPNQYPSIINMHEILFSKNFLLSNMQLPIILGVNIFNQTFIADITKMPHLLIAGATGQGKSIGLNIIILSLIFKKNPYELKFIIIDPKMIEFSFYKKIEKFYLNNINIIEESIITNINKAKKVMIALYKEMKNRFFILKKYFCKNIEEYNKKLHFSDINYLPYIVIIIDEFSELILNNKDIEFYILRLSQMSRAVGLHLIIATQRPSVNIISGSIKANFPTRISFKVTSKIDSKIILDISGAEKLIGNGDMLYLNNNNIIRLQCPFINTENIINILSFYQKKLNKFF